LQISVASSSLISIPIIESIVESEHTFASIITHPDKKVGRGQSVEANPLAQWGSERGLLVAKPADVSEINKHLLEVQPQLVVTASFGKLIPPELLHGPRFGWLNLHFSLLPRWRGAAPVQWAILEGDEISGITVFKLDKGMDTGPIYCQEEIAVGDESTTQNLLDEMSKRGGDLVLRAVEMIRAGERPKAQSTSGITLAPKISKEMGELHWDEAAISIVRKVRALGDRPGTYSSFRGSLLRINATSLSVVQSENRQLGEIWMEGSSLLAQCIDGVIELDEVTPAGKKRMKAVDFARGARLAAGEILGSVKD
jgi:methionyl-tRNA formyltransferase